MMLLFLCKIFGFKFGIKIYNIINKVLEHRFLIHILFTLLVYLYNADSVLFDSGSSPSITEFARRDVSVQELDSRPIHELDSRSRYELDSRPRYELDDGRTHFELWDRTNTENIRNSTESRTYQAYHPGLIETNNGFRSELPANSIRDTNHWELHSRISNPGFYPADSNGGVQSNAPSLSLGEFGKKTVHFKDSYANSFSESKPKSSNFFVDLFKSLGKDFRKESCVEGAGWTNGGDLRRYYTSEERTTFITKVKKH